MTISELIERLEALKAEHGDLNLIFSDAHLTIDPWREVLDAPICWDELDVKHGL